MAVRIGKRLRARYGVFTPWSGARRNRTANRTTEVVAHGAEEAIRSREIIGRAEPGGTGGTSAFIPRIWGALPGRGRRGDDRRAHDGPGAHPQFALAQVSLDLLTGRLGEAVPFQRMPVCDKKTTSGLTWQAEDCCFIILVNEVRLSP